LGYANCAIRTALSLGPHLFGDKVLKTRFGLVPASFLIQILVEYSRIDIELEKLTINSGEFELKS
jgi:hypothetical protein